MLTLSLAVLALITNEPDAATRNLIDAHTAARGGEDAIEAINTVEFHLIINEGWEAEAVYRATRDGQMRIDVSIEGERVFTEALQDGQAWSMAQGVSIGTPIPPEEARILWRGVLGNVYGLHEYPDHDVSLQAGLDAGTGADTLDLVHPDGFAERLYLDPETHDVVRQRSDHALHPAVDPEVRRFETRYSDFREVNGVRYAFRSEKFDLDTGERVQWTQLTSVEINTLDDRSMFARPQ